MTRAIQGLSVGSSRVIEDERGAVLHLLRRDDPSFQGFGECYCSETLPGRVKAWKRHKVQTQNLVVPIGHVRLVIFDDREGSVTRGALEVIELGRPSNYLRVTIPPGLWYGFKAHGPAPALIVNCVDHPHDPAECDRLPESTFDIPYSWTPGACGA